MRRWSLVGCVMVVGCSSSGKARPDAPPDTAPPLACTPFDLTIPVSTAGMNPVWTGEEYVLLVAGYSPVQQPPMDNTLQIVTNDGQLGSIFATVPISEATLPPGHTLAWSGSVLAAVLETPIAMPAQTYTLELALFDAGGVRLGTTMVSAAQYATAPQVVWAGDRFLVVWLDISVVPTQLKTLEITPDGIAGTMIHVDTTDLGHAFNEVFSIAATAGTYAMVVADSGTSQMMVLFDRSTGTMSHFPLDPSLDSPVVVARDTDFVLFADPNNIGRASFATLTPPMTVGAISAVPFADLGLNLVPSTSGFVAAGYDLSSSMTSTDQIDVMDLDASGTALDAEMPIGTMPTGGSTVGPSAVSRGNGYAVVWAWGPGLIDSQRIAQRCAM